jgi:penicillin-binding protein 1A
LNVPYVSTFIYKTKEWITAYKLELFYSKNEILEMYFNTVDYGNNWFGIKVASQNYFSKAPINLSLSESATLVGLLKATSTYNPLRNPKNATGRRDVVLSQMLKYKKISQKEYEKAVASPVKCNQPSNKNDDGKDSYIRQFVEKNVSKWCKDNNYDIYEDGLKIYTTIDSRLQNYAEDAVRWHMRKLQKSFNSQWAKNNPWRDTDGNELKDFIKINIRKTLTFRALAKRYNNDIDSVYAALNEKHKMKVFSWDGPIEVEMSSIDSLSYYAKILNTGMMSMNPYTGEIKAYVGGIDFNFFKYDHVSQARRQPGSTFKPFAYLAALAQDSISVCDRFVDKPVKIEYEGGQIWEPKNSGNRFSYRSMNLRTAMARSCNSITAQLTEKIGWAKVIEYAHKAGIKSHLDSVPSICLGASDVSVNEMVRAYSTFMNKGVRSEPIIVSKILNSDGEVLAEFKSQQEPVIDQQTAWLMCYMLLGALQEPGGTSRALWGYDVFPNNNEIGGKTGTTSNYSDAWYMGMTTDLVTGVWVGADYRSVHFKSDIGQGSKAALPIFAKFLEMAYKDKKIKLKPGPFPKPWTEITKDYLCHSKYKSTIDTSFNDSINFEMRIDSVIKNIEKEEEQEDNTIEENND